jgi:hypothetical protein
MPALKPPGFSGRWILEANSLSWHYYVPSCRPTNCFESVHFNSVHRTVPLNVFLVLLFEFNEIYHMCPSSVRVAILKLKQDTVRARVN